MELIADALTVVGRLRSVGAGLAPGHVTMICGPNGAGKSTLLSALAGLTVPDGGQVRLGENRLADLSGRERAMAIGYLPQAGDVAWNVTVETLVRLGRLPHRTSDRVDAAATVAALTALDLVPLATREVGTLSGGERARALLARVLAGLADARDRARRAARPPRSSVAAAGAPHVALAEDVVARVWGVKARWVGDGRSQALAIG